tara:strand:+ start:1139 stop:1315 length:177 start_codon:yes stop_codon:yes gene_type:complete
MNIESAQYKVDLDGTTKVGIKAKIDGIWCVVPLEPANRHYAEILKQVEAGALTIQEAD